MANSISHRGRLQRLSILVAFWSSLSLCSVPGGHNEAVDDSNRQVMWINIGIGSAHRSEPSGPMWVGIGSYQRGLNTFSLRYLRGEDLSIFADRPLRKATEWALLYGLSFRGSSALASGSIGIAILAGTRHGQLLRSDAMTSEYQPVNFATIGVPLDLRLAWIPLPHVGIGVGFYANVNSVRPFNGWLLTIYIGDK